MLRSSNNYLKIAQLNASHEKLTRRKLIAVKIVSSKGIAFLISSYIIPNDKK